MHRLKWGVALLVLMGTPALAQEWWQGIWAAQADWCAEAENIGAVTPAPIAITTDKVLGYENSCTIIGSMPLRGAGAVHLQLQCQSEGSTFDEDRVLMRTDETGLAVWIWFGSGDPMLFQRCE